MSIGCVWYAVFGSAIHGLFSVSTSRAITAAAFAFVGTGKESLCLSSSPCVVGFGAGLISGFRVGFFAVERVDGRQGLVVVGWIGD